MSDFGDDTRRKIRLVMYVIVGLAIVFAFLLQSMDNPGKHDNPKPTHSASNHK